MATMTRGSNVALTREIPDLTGVVIGVDYDAGSETALAANLVFAALLCDDRDQVLSPEHFVFFNQLSTPDLSVAEVARLLGNDDEQIEIDLSAVPADVIRIVFVLYVNDGSLQRRTLGQLRRCVVRVINRADEKELVRSEDLAAVLQSETAVSLAEIYRHNGDWKFKVLGQGYSKGIAGIAADYGLVL